VVRLDPARVADLQIFSDGELREIANRVIDALAALQRQLASAGEPSRVAELAHLALNEALVVGARELADAFGALERAARAGRSIGEPLRAVENLWPPSRAAIEQIASTPEPG
jgi:hypothetical protein